MAYSDYMKTIIILKLVPIFLLFNAAALHASVSTKHPIAVLLQCKSQGSGKVVIMRNQKIAVNFFKGFGIVKFKTDKDGFLYFHRRYDGKLFRMNAIDNQKNVIIPGCTTGNIQKLTKKLKKVTFSGIDCGYIQSCQ